MLKLGRFVSALPGAVTVTPAFPLPALALITLGGLWLLIWRSSWRWWGLLPVLAGITLALTAPRPDLMIAPDSQTIALRGPDGLLYFPRTPKDRYAAARWLVRDGDSRDWHGAVGGTFIRCDGLGCIAPLGRLTIALARRPEALDDDCARADIVVSGAPAMSCKKPRLVLDAPEIAAAGGYAVTLSPLRATSINRWRGARPWVVDTPPTSQ
jgi:competence protein ComEC